MKEVEFVGHTDTDRIVFVPVVPDPVPSPLPPTSSAKPLLTAETEAYTPLLMKDITDFYVESYANGQPEGGDFYLVYNDNGQSVTQKIGFAMFPTVSRIREEPIDPLDSGYERRVRDHYDWSFMDYNRDGIAELPLGGYIDKIGEDLEWFKLMTFWKTVCEYDVERRVLVNTSAKHKDYYETVYIPELEEAISNAETVNESEIYLQRMLNAAHKIVSGTLVPVGKAGTTNPEEFYWVDEQQIAAAAMEGFEPITPS